MLIVRNASTEDRDAIFELAKGIGPGMTTLKPDPIALADRLALSADSCVGDVPLHQADYLFVLEDLSLGLLCGVSAIKGAVGINEPFYNYRLSTPVHTSSCKGLVNRVQSLHLTHDLTGASELCSLYLHPDYRNGMNGNVSTASRCA